MPLKTVDIGSGHELQDNGCGDYNLICPKHGRTGWIPPLTAMAMGLKKDVKCRSCGNEIQFKNVRCEFED